MEVGTMLGGLGAVGILVIFAILILTAILLFFITAVQLKTDGGDIKY